MSTKDRYVSWYAYEHFPKPDRLIKVYTDHTNGLYVIVLDSRHWDTEESLGFSARDETHVRGDFTAQIQHISLLDRDRNISTYKPIKWRIMGNYEAIPIGYVNYSNIAARVLRKSLKANLRDEAVKRDISAIRYFYWLKGEMLAHGKKLEPEKDKT